MQQQINCVILAAGQGTRMYSSLPKVLHKIGNKALLTHVIETAAKFAPEKLLVVYGHGGDQVQSHIQETLPEFSIGWVLQEQQLGTGHALKCAVPDLSDDGLTIVLYGDVPLISHATLERMLDIYNDNVVILTDTIDNPTGYGRIVRNLDGQITEVVEEKDATPEQKAIREINSGIYILPNKYLGKWLNSLANNNSQNEYYLTDVIKYAHHQGVVISSVNAANHYEVSGVNNKLQLEQLERVYQISRAEQLLTQGATLLDKNRLDIRGDVTVGKDCVIDINCVLSGKVILANNVTIGAGVILTNVSIADNVTIKPYSIIEDAKIGANAIVGPYARIRPGTELSDNTHVGNFVEIKKSIIGQGSKINHLTYVGDAIIGKNVNVGAGSVTCNYDGKTKYTTTIKDNVFIGSGTMMVAPVTIGENSVIGAGSVITNDTPDNELTIARVRQTTIYGWLANKNKK